MPHPTAMGQMTGAARALTAMVRGGGPTRRRKARKARPAARRKKSRARASSKRPARLVKGSAAAKRYMASIRRKRRG